jgi:4-alpha-glucanotransferase
LEDYKRNFGFSHKCGILMPVSSLPSPYGIGTFGKGAFDFVDFLSETRQTCWQVLPLNPTSYGDSPYQSPASGAGNPYFIDPVLLKKEKLLTDDELKACVNRSNRVDYGWLFNTRYTMLRTAYSRFAENREYRAFCKKSAYWLEDYALFMALKIHYGYMPWTCWAEKHRDYEQARLDADTFREEMGFWKWIQYEFTRQWNAVRSYANKKGIMIIGDVPIYVAHDSVDVWKDTAQFELDESYNPVKVAGCPPDGFSPDGQRWGNPLYNWELMEQDGFAWWIRRVKRCFELYDILRIDHFRGFASYYSIPACDDHARRGVWLPAPGKALFDTIKAALPKTRIIAEDLGFITPDVRELLEYTGFPGMKVLQFAFYDDDSEYLPRTYTTDNCVVYAGSHDSDCVYTWHKNMNGAPLKRFKRECPRRKGQNATYATIELGMRSRANLAIVPLQDYLVLTNEQGRMNTPSVADGNWGWRVSPRYATKSLVAKVTDMAVRTGRAAKA